MLEVIVGIIIVIVIANLLMILWAIINGFSGKNK